MGDILAIVFALSGYANGASLSAGVGMVDNGAVYANPVGVVRAQTSVVTGAGWSIDLNATHVSSIPDATDALTGVETNILSIEFVAHIGGHKTR